MNINGDAQKADPAVAQQSNVVKELSVGQIRWCAQIETQPEKFILLTGQDSFRIEQICHSNAGSAAVKEYVPVWGALHELTKEGDVWTLKPAYWKGREIVLRRGTWFIGGDGLQPLDENFSARVERRHLELFSGHDVSSITVSNAPSHEMMDAEEEKVAKSGVIVKWFGPKDVYLYDYRGVSRFRRLVNWPKVAKLYRGRKETPNVAPPCYHLVMVTHGIRQGLFEDNINQNCEKIRANYNFLRVKYFKGSDFCVDFLAADWRSGLLAVDTELTKDLLPLPENHVSEIGVKAALDGLHYLTEPDAVKGSMTKVMNDLFQEYDKRHKGFIGAGGQVACIAHSLGAVVLFDILSKGFGLNSVGSLRASIQSGSGLLFKITNLFAVGSPLAYCLGRWFGRGVDRPWCRTLQSLKLYNLFDPEDRVAARMEPLFLKAYAGIPPIAVHRYDSKDQNYDTSPLSRDEIHSSDFLKESAASTSQVDMPYRLDFALNTFYWHWYTALRGAHIGYWSNLDLAMFLSVMLSKSPKERGDCRNE